MRKFLSFFLVLALLVSSVGLFVPSPVYADTLEVSPGQSSDDCYRRLGDDLWSLTYTQQMAGADDGAGKYQYGGGMRFPSITIPQGAVIDTAYIVFVSDADRGGDTTRTRLSAEDVDDAATFADSKAAFDSRWAGRTTARVDWDNIDAWSIGESGADTTTPEIKTVIQEIIDRPGWSSGNDIVIFWEDFDDRSSHNDRCVRVAATWDDTTYDPPLLHIEYTKTPSMTTNAATSVEETSATLDGDITAVNNGSCSVRGFEWDTDSGSPYANDWNEAGAFGVSNYTHGITSLNKGDLYYYRAYATNINGTGYGAEQTLLTKPDPPSGLSITVSSSTLLTLAWTKGNGADRTMVRFSKVAAPTSVVEGSLCYLGTEAGYGHSGLDPGTLYYYSIWSEVTTGGHTKYSDTYVSGSATTTSTSLFLDDFKYYIPITITSSCSSSQELRLPFIINSKALSDGDSVEADFDDVMLAKVHTLLPLTLTDITAETLHCIGEATADGLVTTLIDDVNLTQVDDYWNSCTVEILTTTDSAAPEGETDTVSDFDQGTNKLTFGALTAITNDEDTYKVDNYRSKWFTILDLDPYEQVVLRLYLGYTAADPAEREFCTEEDDVITVTDHADFDIADMLSVTATVVLYDLPGAEKKFLEKGSAYELGIDANNKPYFSIWSGAAEKTATGSAALVEDTEYILLGTFNDTTDEVNIYVGGVEKGSTVWDGAIDENASNIALNEVDCCEIDDIKIGHTSLVAPTWVLDLDMECANIGQASIVDQSGSSHDATVTWDISIPSCIDIEVGATTEVATWEAPGGESGTPPSIYPLPTFPTNWFASKTDCSNLPVYNLFSTASTYLGWPCCKLYSVMAIFTAVSIGAAVGMITASALIAGTAVGAFLAMAAGANLVGWWWVIFYAIVAIGYLVSSRSM